MITPGALRDCKSRSPITSPLATIPITFNPKNTLTNILRAAPPAPEFQGYIGVSQKDITPPVGIFARNWGAATHDVAEGIHRPMTLTCVTFRQEQGTPPLVLIGADLGWWKNAAHERILRESILETLSLPASDLMFCLAHTHAGPGICLDDEHKPGGHMIRPYFERLIQTSVEAIREALDAGRPAILTWKYGECNLAVNRDFPDPDGERILTGYNPGEPADNTLLVGRIADADGRITGTLVNYACHPTTLAWQNKLISPDYIGAMRALTEESTGAPCLFLQGASGEVSPPQQFTGDTALADRYGRQLGYSVLATLESMEAPATRLAYKGVVESGASLAMWEPEPAGTSGTVKAVMATIEYPLKEFASLAELEAEWSACADHVLRERLWRKICIRKAIGDGETAQTPLWVWKLGRSILVGQPNEAYTEFQIGLREQYPDHAIAVMNLTNGSVGYLPPRSLYDFNAYAVWQTPFGPGSFELLKQTTTDLVGNLISSP